MTREADRRANAARRQLRCRKRADEGLVLLEFEAEEHPLAHAAVASGLLSEEEAMSKSKLAKAAAAVVRAWTKNFSQ